MFEVVTRFPPVRVKYVVLGYKLCRRVNWVYTILEMLITSVNDSETVPVFMSKMNRTRDGLMVSLK